MSIRYMMIGLLMVAALAAPGSAQSSWDRYQPGKLASIVERHRASIEDDTGRGPQFHVSAQTFPTRVDLIFTGDTRRIASDHRQILRMWATMMLGDSTRVAEYQEEWRFREGSAEFWLPIQSETAASMRRVATRGMRITVWAQWFGAIRRDGTTSWVFPAMMTETHERAP